MPEWAVNVNAYGSFSVTADTYEEALGIAEAETGHGIPASFDLAGVEIADVVELAT